jgi:hypothetical protein
MDIDFLGRIENSVETLVKITREICQQEVEPDGIAFDLTEVDAERIAEDADYEGIRIRFRGSLDTARFVIQLDIGFGDVIVPSPELMNYPTILDLPAPHLRGYSMESTIAEKFEAMVKLGILNSRMKDFFDIWLMSRQFDFDGTILSEAITKTFFTRGAKIPAEPLALTDGFAEDSAKDNQWRGFVRRNRLSEAPKDLAEVIVSIGAFLKPISQGLAAGHVFKLIWKAPGPWSE